MGNRYFTLNKANAVFFVGFYIAGILVWDYSWIYQVALMLMAGVALVLYKERIVIQNPYISSSFLLILYFFFHTFSGLSRDSSNSWSYLVTMGINFIAAVSIIRIVDTKSKIEWVLRCVIVISFALTLYAILFGWRSLLQGGETAAVVKPLTGGSYSHNDISLAACLGILFLVYFRMCGTKMKGFWPCLLFLLAYVVLSAARKSLIFALISVVVYPILLSTKSERVSVRFLKILALILVCGLVVLLLFTNEFLFSTVGRRFAGAIAAFTNRGEVESSARSRLIMIDTAISAIKGNVIIGHGLNTFQTLPGSFNTWSHNNYLEVMVSGGIIAAAIYYFAPVIALIKLRKEKNNYMAGMFLTWCVFFFIYDMLSISYIDRLVGFMMSMMFAYLNILKKESSNK